MGLVDEDEVEIGAVVQVGHAVFAQREDCELKGRGGLVRGRHRARRHVVEHPRNDLIRFDIKNRTIV